MALTLGDVTVGGVFLAGMLAGIVLMAVCLAGVVLVCRQKVKRKS